VNQGVDLSEGKSKKGEGGKMGKNSQTEKKSSGERETPEWETECGVGEKVEGPKVTERGKKGRRRNQGGTI